MELRHLRYFVAVAEEEHMTRAARRVGIQQPPLSQQIQQLEQELQVKLFDRKPRSVKLNASGRIFLADVRRLLAHADEAVQRVRDFSHGRDGTVRIGLTSSASMHAKTLTIMRQFKRSYPLLNLKVVEGTNLDLITMLEQELLDVAIVRTPPERPNHLTQVELDEEEVVACLPRDSDLVGKEQLTLEDLRDQPFIRYRQVNGPGIWGRFEQFCRDRMLEPHVVENTERTLSAIHLVGAGAGVTVVPHALIGILSGAVTYLPFAAQDRFTVPLVLVSRIGAQAQPTRLFIDLARKP